MSKFSISNMVAQMTTPVFIDAGSETVKFAFGRRSVITIPARTLQMKNDDSVREQSTVEFTSQSTSKYLLPIRCVEGGRIVDVQVFKGLLEKAIKQVSKELLWWQAFGAIGQVWMVVQPDISPVQRQIMRTAVQRYPWIGVSFISRGVALIASIDLGLLSGQTQTVIDLGTERTELTAIRFGQIVASENLSMGAIDVFRELQHMIRKNYHLETSQQEIVKVVTSIGCLMPKQVSLAKSRSAKKDGTFTIKETVAVVQGKSSKTGHPESVTVSQQELFIVLSNFFERMVEQIRFFLESLPTEASVEVLNQGIYLGGGMSQLSGVSEYFSQQLGVAVYQIEKPETASVRGARELQASKKIDQWQIPVQASLHPSIWKKMIGR